jgi:hypothetical protein
MRVLRGGRRALCAPLLLLAGALSGCEYQSSRRFPPPVLEPVGQGRIVVVPDQAGSETILGLPSGALSNAAWPVRVDAEQVCFEVLIRLWEAAQVRLVKADVWSFSLLTPAGEVEEIAAGHSWTARKGPYGWEGTGVVCFPRSRVDLTREVELHARGKMLEIVFRWEPG